MLLEDIAKYFLIEVISIGFMTNHFHRVCFAPGQLPSPQEAADRHNAYYGTKKIELNPSVNLEKCESAAKQMVDIGEFMRQF